MSYIVILMSFTAIFPSIGYALTNIDNELFIVILMSFQTIYSINYASTCQRRIERCSHCRLIFCSYKAPVTRRRELPDSHALLQHRRNRRARANRAWVYCGYRGHFKLWMNNINVCECSNQPSSCLSLPETGSGKA